MLIHVTLKNEIFVLPPFWILHVMSNKLKMNNMTGSGISSMIFCIIHYCAVISIHFHDYYNKRILWCILVNLSQLTNTSVLQSSNLWLVQFCHSYYCHLMDLQHWQGLRTFGTKIPLLLDLVNFSGGSWEVLGATKILELPTVYLDWWRLLMFPYSITFWAHSFNGEPSEDCPCLGSSVW